MSNPVANPFANLPEDQVSAIHALVGRTLKSGWLVTEKAVAKPGSTGSHFSVCYLVEKDGKKGFLKAINLLKFLNGDQPDIATAFSEMLQTYNFEKELLSRCRNKNLSKVSRLLDTGEEHIPGYFIGNVLYLIFEKADGDVRGHLNFAQNVDLAWKLRSLHNIAVGLKQLHSIEISHQDLKPSNVFLFDKSTSKLGDLGRSLCKSFEGPHSKMNFSGDSSYAPPEYFFSYYIKDWEERTFAIDFYLLGSMIVYYFLGINMTALLFKHLNPGIDWQTFNKFEELLPSLIEAFDKSLIVIENNIYDNPFKEEIKDLIKQLCYPCPTQRGRKILNSRGNQFNLERIVTKLNLIATKADHLITK